MADRNSQQVWECKREIPNPDVRRVADQYEMARQILIGQPPEKLLTRQPLMLISFTAIELYLKSLAAVVDLECKDDMYLVHAKASKERHRLAKIFCQIDVCTQTEMESSYDKTPKRTLGDDLIYLDEARVFTYARYPYEYVKIPPYGPEKPEYTMTKNLESLSRVSGFLREFVANLEPRVIVVRKDGSTSTAEDLLPRLAVRPVDAVRAPLIPLAAPGPRG